MATDATGTPTSLGIPKFNVSADAPSGLGSNAQMDSIDALVAARIAKPSSPSSGDALVWDGSAWAKSSGSTKVAVAGIAPGSNGQVLTTSGGVPTWAAASGSSVELDYQTQGSDVTISATTEGTANAVITGNSVTYENVRHRIELMVPHVTTGGSTTGNITFILLRDSTVLGQLAFIEHLSNTSRAFQPVFATAFDTPSAASHTYKVQAFRATNNWTLKAGAGGSATYLPITLRVTKAA